MKYSTQVLSQSKPECAQHIITNASAHIKSDRDVAKSIQANITKIMLTLQFESCNGKYADCFVLLVGFLHILASWNSLFGCALVILMG